MNTQGARLKRLEQATRAGDMERAMEWIANASDEELLRSCREDMDAYEKQYGPVQPASPELIALADRDRWCDLTDAELLSVGKHIILQREEQPE